MEKVEDMEIGKDTTLEELAKEYEKSGGFSSKKLAEGVSILSDILRCDIKFLSFPAAIISTGTRGVIKELLRRKMFNIVITTCGTLDHDFARCFEDYYHGSFEADDTQLRKKNIHRLGNIFIPNRSYGEVIEEKLQPILADIYAKGKRHLSTYELCWEIGSRLSDKNSILYWIAKNKIPMIIPGITDGAVGFQLVMFMQDHKDFIIDVFKDEQFLLDKLFGSKQKSGALILGGGISKHHVIWWNQFKDGLDCAVYVTTAVEYDGSLSGARTREAISWGKLKSKARHVTIEGDATVLLPLLVGPFL
jgi:deoxyhypusine synthase